jgi:hypothetical protein
VLAFSDRCRAFDASPCVLSLYDACIELQRESVCVCVCVEGWVNMQDTELGCWWSTLLPSMVCVCYNLARGSVVVVRFGVGVALGSVAER